MSDGTVWAWGSNRHGQLGDGSGVDTSTPVQVSGLTGVIAITTNAIDSAYALKQDGTVWAWARTIEGRLATEPRRRDMHRCGYSS
jgi:alpha-tubulin suppressor-like RCC1 family protein